MATTKPACLDSLVICSCGALLILLGFAEAISAGTSYSRDIVGPRPWLVLLAAGCVVFGWGLVSLFRRLIRLLKSER
jgi:hypothetical protein